MKTTIDSTGLDDQNRARRLPPDLLHRTNVLLDELERLRASKPDDAHARQCRTDSIEQLVLLALDNDSLRVALLAVAPCYRVAKVRHHLRDNMSRYNITKPPHPDTIRAILRKHKWL
ncbi:MULTISPECIES: hypothetical protein [Pseudomonas]|uniref:Uncharacterized protein n=1 Tax=Pseudomonas fluorescens TaxID=294 RepID=A0A161YZ83_PSEFL|nr:MULTISPECIES: hypothetical protein [Pseudomonas]KZN16207.1 hypothetical protein A1D17_08570 [Pseudomonas fluorescens]